MVYRESCIICLPRGHTSETRSVFYFLLDDGWHCGFAWKKHDISKMFTDRKRPLRCEEILKDAAPPPSMGEQHGQGRKKPKKQAKSPIHVIPRRHFLVVSS